MRVKSIGIILFLGFGLLLCNQPLAEKVVEKEDVRVVQKVDQSDEDLEKKLEVIMDQLGEAGEIIQKKIEQGAGKYKEAIERYQAALLKAQQEMQKEEYKKQGSNPSMMPGMGMGFGMGMPGMDPGMMGFFPQAGTPQDRSDWEVRFHPFDSEAEPFLPLLESLLPAGSKVNFNKESGLMAVYSSPDGHGRAEQFFAELEQKRQQAGSPLLGRSKRSTGGQGMMEEPGGSVQLEILLLNGQDSPQLGRGADFSKEAQEMGITPDDLSFLGRKTWKTYGKGFTRVEMDERFRTKISDCDVMGAVQNARGENLEVNLSLNFPAGRSVETVANVKLGQPTLMLSTSSSSDEGLMVAVLLPTKEKQDPAQTAKQGLDTVIPSLTFRKMDMKTALSAIAQNAGLSIVTHEDVEGSITMSVKNVTARKALELILKDNGCQYEIDSDGVIHISPKGPKLQYLK